MRRLILFSKFDPLSLFKRNYCAPSVKLLDHLNSGGYISLTPEELTPNENDNISQIYSLLKKQTFFGRITENHQMVRTFITKKK